jgi:hypothetical protein
MRRGRALLGIVLGLLAAGAAWGQGQKVELTFKGQTVAASGLTPGKPVVWFGVEHRIDAGYSTDLTQHYEVGTAAADGTATLDLSQPPSPRSYWAAVDLGTGAYALSTPDGSAEIVRAAQRSSLDVAAGSRSDGLVDTRQYLMGLLVRPGVGAWTFAGADGGPRDEDANSDGHLRFALDGLNPLPGSSAAPSRVDQGDVWLIVDPLAMEITVLKGGVAQ